MGHQIGGVEISGEKRRAKTASQVFVLQNGEMDANKFSG